MSRWKLSIEVSGSDRFLAETITRLAALATLKMWNADEWNGAGGGGGWDEPFQKSVSRASSNLQAVFIDARVGNGIILKPKGVKND